MRPTGQRRTRAGVCGRRGGRARRLQLPCPGNGPAGVATGAPGAGEPLASNRGTTLGRATCGLAPRRVLQSASKTTPSKPSAGCLILSTSVQEYLWARQNVCRCSQDLAVAPLQALGRVGAEVAPGAVLQAAAQEQQARLDRLLAGGPAAQAGTAPCSTDIARLERLRDGMADALR